jgi:hypothetical protein
LRGKKKDGFTIEKKKKKEAARTHAAQIVPKESEQTKSISSRKEKHDKTINTGNFSQTR